MRIVHFLLGRCNADTANGVEKTIFHLAINQAAAGHEVHVIGISAKPPIPIPGVHVLYFAPARFQWQLPATLADRIIEIEPDFVHFHSAYVPANIVLAALLRKAGIPYAVTPNGNCARQLLARQPYLKIPYKMVFEKPYLNHANFVHAVGDAEEIRRYGVKAAILDAPNGIDIETLPRWSGENLLLKKYPHFKGKSTFVFLGRLDTEQKGIDLLFTGMRLALDQGTEVGVALVGPDWKGRKAGLERLARKLGIENLVVWPGPSYGAEKYEYLYSGDFFIHTSRWEGMAFSVVEALACGKPCLVTPAANPCGLIQKYAAGLVVEPNPEAIADGLRKLTLSTATQREAMSKGALKLVGDELAWEKIAAVVTEGYRTYRVPAKG